jgi:hypothetical protein
MLVARDLWSRHGWRWVCRYNKAMLIHYSCNAIDSTFNGVYLRTGAPAEEMIQEKAETGKATGA